MHSLSISDYVAVVTDFDDTILDNKPNIPGQGLHERSRLDALRAVGRSKGLPALSKLPAEVNAVAFHHAPVHSAEGAFWWLLVQARLVKPTESFDSQHPIIAALIAAKSESYRKLLTIEAAEVPGAQNFFRKLYEQGFAGRLAVASSGHRQDILAFFDTHGFAEYFKAEHIITKEDTQNPKPHPEVFIKAIKSLGVLSAEPPRILAFEDDPRGISAAKAANMFTCAVTTCYSRAELLAQPIKPDVVAADFNEYIDIFHI